jgi:hypothetical protein
VSKNEISQKNFFSEEVRAKPEKVMANYEILPVVADMEFADNRTLSCAL